MATPVKTIVIPGIAGSQLSFRGGRAGKTVLWYDPLKMLAYTPLSLALAADGVSPYPGLGKDLFSDGPVQLGIYEPLLTQLANDGLAPRFWSYDWRIDLRQSAANFVQFLGNTPDLAATFNVVAHSMGGLIAQLAYPLWEATTPTKTWATTLYLATPQGGAHWSAAELAGVYADGSELSALSIVYRLQTIPLANGPSVFTAIRSTFGTMIGSWPSVYQLLPNSAGKWQGLDPLAPQLLTASNYDGYPGTRHPEWFTAAINTQALLVANYARPRPREVSFIANGWSTLSRVITPTRPGVLTSYASSYDGDGTVTVERATLGIGSELDVMNTRHNAICYTGGPLSMIAEALVTPLPENASTDNTAQPASLKQPILPLPSEPPVPPVEFRNKTGDP